MGEHSKIILNKVAQDHQIRRNLKDQKLSEFTDDRLTYMKKSHTILGTYEVYSNLTDEEIGMRRQVMKDKLRAHQIKNLILMKKKREKEKGIVCTEEDEHNHDHGD